MTLFVKKVYNKVVKCLFIFNPKSGKGKIAKKLDKIVSCLNGCFDLVEVHPSANNQDVLDCIVSKQNEIDCVVVAGGDGTISQAVNGILQTGKKIKLGLLPFGTVNDVAHSLKISRRTNKALKVIAGGKTFLHDAIKVNNRYGIYVFGFGLFTETSYNTSQKAKKKFGRIAYAFHALKKLQETKNKNLTFFLDGEKVSTLSSFFLMSNSRFVAGQKIEKNVLLNDGKAKAVLIKSKREKPSLVDFSRIIKLFVFGLKRSSHVVTEHITNAEIICPEKINFNLDGECFVADKVKLSIIRQAIEIFVP